MNDREEIGRYLNEIRRELGDVDPKLRASIVKEIEGHLREKLEEAGRGDGGGKPGKSSIREILTDFGEPGEIADEYRRQLSEGGGAPPQKTRKGISGAIGVFLAVGIIMAVFPVFLVIQEVRSR